MTSPYAAAVSDDELLAALRALLATADHTRSPEWQVVDRWTRQRLHDCDREVRADARQETLITISRSLPQLRAQDARGVVAWAFAVWQSRVVDVRRSRAAHLSRSFGEDAAELAAPDLVATEVARAAVFWTFSEVERHLDTRRASKRSKRRQQARAALLRLVLGYDLEEVERDLRLRLAPATLHTWTRHGRAYVLDALARWQAAEPGDEQVAAIVEVLGELMREGRADAGKPRARGRAA